MYSCKEERTKGGELEGREEGGDGAQQNEGTNLLLLRDGLSEIHD